MTDDYRNRYRYVAEATNRMMEVSAYVERQPVEALAQAAAQACDALTMLLEDRFFHEDLEKWQRLADDTAEERAAFQREIELLASYFLKAEKQALIDAGLDDNAVEQILWAAAAYKDAAADPLDPQRIAGRINNLRSSCCEAATTLYRMEDDRQRWRTFRRISFGVGGVSLIVADMVSAAPTGGVAAASMTIGGTMVGGALG